MHGLKLDADAKLSRAKIEAVREFPFFGLLILGCEFLEDPHCAALWSDGRRIGYNPDFVARCEVPELVWLLAHEALHNAFAHVHGLGARDAQLYNLAADFWVNGRLEEEAARSGGQRLRRPDLARLEGRAQVELALDPARFSQLSSEAIYAELVRETLRQDRSGQGAGGGESASEQDAASASSGRGGEDPLEGSGSGDAFAQYDQGGMNGDLNLEAARERGASSDAQRAADAAYWSGEVARAAEVARQHGSFPAELARAVTALLEPQLPWTERLAAFVQPSLEDYRWEMPDRRFSDADFILPAVEGSRLEVVLAVDVSGSIRPGELRRFVSEAAAVLHAFDRVEAWLLACDAEVRYFGRISVGEALPTEFPGGGGTDFRPVFERLEQAGILPHALVYLTDGFGRYPRSAPTYPVLWVLTEQGGSPPFGEVLRLGEHSLAR
ncbi:putative metal-dependent peptidase [Deinobacterium chartae]|uniref:Putative metal-dependent peptidase n=1 Tax=Deinobacterium chartae TaxID=521158 RepID=A0A841I129_9DEIO|nr:VWA-like domain-containing protein [Deinobacterium chartae]MBB6097792.1 putative metal-dependent peptidase [Deinobacterium chartae]